MNSDIIIVSGLPRSGTSMMMAMLQAGGVPLLTDAARAPDDDNPKGYFEYDPVRRLRNDAAWMGAARGKAVKVISYLLPALPERYRYMVVYMERAIGEVLASQKAMLQRAGKPHNPEDDALLEHAFHKAEADARDWMAGMANVKAHFVAYRNVLGNPVASAEALQTFLGRDLYLDAMANAFDQTLYRQRGKNKTP